MFVQAALNVRQIENGYIVSSSDQRSLVGGGGPGERYFATFDEMVGDLPAILRTALAEARKQQEAWQEEIAQRRGMSSLAGGAQADVAERPRHFVG